MATRNKLNKISTTEILEELKKADDNTEFFYLYASTAGKEYTRHVQLPVGQQSLDTKRAEDEDSDDTEENDEQMDVNTTEDTSQPISPQNILSSTMSKDKPRKKAMETFHQTILPQVLAPDGWRKVYDKDMKITYRALYFNTIKKNEGEDNTSYIKRVSKIRERLAKEADELKGKNGVNFKTNFLLSKPFLYDDSALEEQLTREGSTQKQPTQTRLDKYYKIT